MTCTVFLHIFHHTLIELLAILWLCHVDEVNDNDAAHVAQSELSCKFVGCSEVNIQGIDLLSFGTLAAIARVDVHHVQGFCVLDDHIGAVLIRYRATERRFNLFSHREIVKNRHVAFVELHNVFSFWCNESDIVTHLFIDILVVDVDTGERRIEQISKESNSAARFLVNQCCFFQSISLLYVSNGAFPATFEDAQLLVKLCNATSFRYRADDDAETFRFDAMDELFETRALSVAFDFGGHTHLVGEGNEHQIAACKGDFTRETWTFGRDGFFDNLNKYFLPYGYRVLDLPIFFGVGLARYFIQGKGLTFPSLDQT